jgi:hypothetical protein
VKLFPLDIGHHPERPENTMNQSVRCNLRHSLIAFFGVAVLWFAGCSKDPSNAPTAQPQPRNPPPSLHALDGVWDFITEVKTGQYGALRYLRGTLYVSGDQAAPKCELMVYEEVGFQTSAAEQSCQIFSTGKDYSIKSTVIKASSASYLPDDFKLEKKTDYVLLGTLISNNSFEVTFVKRGSGYSLEEPFLQEARAEAKAAVLPYSHFTTGVDGCEYGQSAKRYLKDKRYFVVDVRKVCPGNLAIDRIKSNASYWSLTRGLLVDCSQRSLTTIWGRFDNRTGHQVRGGYRAQDGTWRGLSEEEALPAVGMGTPARGDPEVLTTLPNLQREIVRESSVFSPLLQAGC